jgi:hypothetical protein
MQSHLLRLRFGVLLIVLSWFPFAQITIQIAHSNGNLTNDGSATVFRLVIWGIQIVVGLVGLLLVGKVAVEEAKRTGWRATPRRVWQLFVHGSQPS